MVLNGNGRAWLDKWMWEIVRLATVAVIALGGAYWSMERAHASLSRDFFASQEKIARELHSQCVSGEAVRGNQTVVLLSLISLADVLSDRQQAGLEKVPPRLRASLLAAISQLPDRQDC